MSPKDARAVLKATNAEVWTLYLKSSDRDKLRSWFESLWSKLNSKYEEANTAWRSRQEAGLSKLTESRNRLYDSLNKVRDNISNNWSKYSDAKSSEFQDVVRGWISEGESREKELESWIKDLDDKIDDCRSRLRG
jgi:gas vesicle protein